MPLAVNPISLASCKIGIKQSKIGKIGILSGEWKCWFAIAAVRGIMLSDCSWLQILKD
ncbi:MAG: hypothetical protein KAQ89_04830 [Planctomycetes bacterium]|nr:hypothetical protein [Planctomycetota bacterium]